MGLLVGIHMVLDSASKGQGLPPRPPLRPSKRCLIYLAAIRQRRVLGHIIESLSQGPTRNDVGNYLGFYTKSLFCCLLELVKEPLEASILCVVLSWMVVKGSGQGLGFRV